MFDLENKVALVSGGANGIGAAIVEEFIKEKAKYVAVLDIDESAGQDLEKKLKSNYGEEKVAFIKCDVTNNDELYSAYDAVIQNHGCIDIVVNNAGIANDEIYKKEIEINFTSVITSSLKALDHMREDRGGKGGTIINVSSVSALALLSPTLFIYGATKAAVLHFTSSIGKEKFYSKTKVRTISMCYGATETELKSKIRSFDEELTANMHKIVKYDPIQTAEEAAQGTVKAFKSGESGSVWLVWCKVEDITKRVEAAYETMADDIFD